jgi:hypothetical protein
MPKTRIITQTVYQFDELSDKAKERAREWYREAIDENDYECEISEFADICEMIGIGLDTHEVKLMSGKTRQDPNIYWSVGYCQSDYAAFEGTYDYKADACIKLREMNDDDTWAPLRIAMVLAKIQAENAFGLRATVKITNKDWMQIEVIDRRNEERYSLQFDEVIQLMRDLARYLYKQLRDQSDYLNSDENIDEMMEANEYEFDEEGERI